VSSYGPAITAPNKLPVQPFSLLPPLPSLLSSLPSSLLPSLLPSLLRLRRRRIHTLTPLSAVTVAAPQRQQAAPGARAISPVGELLETAVLAAEGLAVRAVGETAATFVRSCSLFLGERGHLLSVGAADGLGRACGGQGENEDERDDLHGDYYFGLCTAG
jgi:hypothetical protein